MLRRLLLLIFLIPAVALGQAGKFGDEFSTVHVAPVRTYDVKSYTIDVTLGYPQNDLAGTATISLNPLTDGLKEIALDSAELDIGTVEANGRSVDFALSGNKLRIELDRPYRSTETVVLKIRYTGHPRKGLYWVVPDSAYPNKPRQIWSQGEDQDSRYWFPCYDFPDDKATTETLVTVRKPFRAVSNGRLIEVRDRGDSRTFHWKMDRAHSTYLTSIAVGDFDQYSDKAGNVSVEYYVPKGTGREKTLRSFGSTPRILTFFSSQIGIPYPYPKYAQIAVADFLFGGMENISATHQTLTALHDERAHQDFPSENLVAHELAHQWWGDLVTLADWSQAWLNEGFATYFEALYAQKTWGEDEYRFKLYNDANDYFREDGGRYRRPIVTARYTDSIDMFDAHTYKKGSVVLGMLRYVLGDADFFKALQHYGNEFAERNATTNDFKDAIQESTGKNLDWFFQQWLYKAGYPEYDVTWAWEGTGARIDVRQIQRLDDLVPLFDMPVVVDFMLPGGKIETFKVQVKDGAHSFTFPLEARPTLVRFDPGNAILKRLRFQKTEDELLFQIANDADVIGRIRAIEDLKRLSLNDAVLDGLAAVLAKDTFYGVRAAAADALGGLRSNRSRDVLIKASHDNDSRVRQAVVAALGRFERDSLAITTVTDVLKSDRSYATQASAATALRNTKAENAMDILSNALRIESHNDVVRRSVLRALAGLNMPDRVRPLILEWAKYGKPNGTRTTAISLFPQIARGAEREISGRLIDLLDDPWIFSRESAIEALGDMKAADAIDALEIRAQIEVDDGLRKAARESISRIRGN